MTDSTLNPMVGIVVTTSPIWQRGQHLVSGGHTAASAPSTCIVASSFQRYPRSPKLALHSSSGPRQAPERDRAVQDLRSGSGSPSSPIQGPTAMTCPHPSWLIFRLPAVSDAKGRSLLLSSERVKRSSEVSCARNMRRCVGNGAMTTDDRQRRTVKATGRRPKEYASNL